MINRFAKIAEILYLIIAGICLIETIANFYNGNTKFGLIFLVGVLFGLSMSYTRRRMRLKMENKNNEK